MGDRTWCQLSVQKDDREAVEKILQPLGSADETNDTGIWIEYTFHEVNYGELRVSNELQHAGIPFDWVWAAGSEYGPGSLYQRYTEDGESEQKEIFDESINPDLCQLMKLIDKPEELIQYIKKHKTKITETPWDNQEEYKKLYRAKQLITT